jgi:3-hydroxyisobutyrate dehydrogenase-like beta-hydroxyacid dehydrogenase
MIVAILGIGEAGGALARDLITAGVKVRGWDPNPRAIPVELDFASSNPAAVKGADVVLRTCFLNQVRDKQQDYEPTLSASS